MTEAELQLSLIYTAAFKNRAEWTQEDHLRGLAAVFMAGSKARDKAETSAWYADRGALDQIPASSDSGAS